ncbi:Sel1-repeat-containing protein YbeQ, partial [Durusdinium trenchii]
CAEYQLASTLLKRVVESKLLPLLQHLDKGVPELVASSAFIRWASAPEEEGGSAECEADHWHYYTVLLPLYACELLLQPAPTRRSRRRQLLAKGDLFIHRFDLPTSLRDGCYLVLKFKDSMLSCLTNTAPWHTDLAKEGDADAQWALALQLQQRDASASEVLRWLRSAAEQGHADAQACLGERCEEDSLSWLHEAALQGHRRAQRALAERLHVQGNRAEAQKWLRRAAEEEDLQAAELLVVCLVREGEISEALHWCRWGAGRGSASLQHRWGLHLLAGECCTKDEAAGLAWLRRAAEQGHPEATNNLGVALAIGLGIAPDLQEAQRHWRAAARLGDSYGAANAAKDAANTAKSATVVMSEKQLAELQQLMKEVNELQEEAQGEAMKQKVAPLADLLRQLRDSAAPRAPPSHDAHDAPVPRGVTAVARASAAVGLGGGEPFILRDAMDWLSGQKVLDFMPRLMTACGRDVVAYEIQGKGMSAQSMAAPFAQYIQQLQRSDVGAAYLMSSDQLLERPELQDLLQSPEGLAVRGDMPPLPHWLTVGGAGAKTLLKRDPVVTASWTMLVLGSARWSLLPPGSSPSLAGPPDRWGDTRSEEDAFNREWPEVWTATQEMGEVLVVPPGWWYQMLLEDRVLAISAQFLAKEHQPLVAKELPSLGCLGSD